MMRKCTLITGILVLLMILRVNANESAADVISTDAAVLYTGEESFLIPDTVFRKFCIELGCADEKGYIIPAEAAKVTWLSVGRKNIVSLEGIKYFTSLEKLTCYYTPLASLDVSGCSSLKELYCNHNASLVSLNVNGCTSLEKLYCYNTPLVELNVSGCKSLVCLRCHDNTSLVTLYVKGCAALKELYCHNDHLSGVDLSGCTSLRTLYCYGNFITRLDATVMPEGKGFRLFCGNQTSDGVTGQSLELTLTPKQKERWDDYMISNGSNVRVNVAVR
ncbi:leucine-rich repeat domain-containing protein [Butyricimonas sp. Marseille-P3923]|uniref:leucine-rich repeat domain-containing protein n=1 Tax=Butyricimonas sp. Marseille-P3923 TaxID=1987504 RepID=UPI000C07D6E1|nr:leucine-rich repeat domain-containing protein [Butyricimonas sp. Marseille-P3923]